MREPSARLVAELGITAEVCGSPWSDLACRAVELELARYDEEQVIAALVRCRRELTGRLTLAAIVGHIHDGRPSADEAWGLVAAHESHRSLICVREVAEAFAMCQGILRAGDLVGARMCFIATYRDRVARSRAARAPVELHVQLGVSPRERQLAIEAAVSRGLLSASAAARHLAAAKAEKDGPRWPQLTKRAPPLEVPHHVNRLLALSAPRPVTTEKRNEP